MYMVNPDEEDEDAGGSKLGVGSTIGGKVLDGLETASAGGGGGRGSAKPKFVNPGVGNILAESGLPPIQEIDENEPTGGAIGNIGDKPVSDHEEDETNVDGGASTGEDDYNDKNLNLDNIG